MIILEEFQEFIKTNDCFDLSVINNQRKDSYLDFIPKEKHKFIEIIGKIGDGSIIAIWKQENTDWLKSPIVYLDSEGEFNLTFSVDFYQFLSFLPYGISFIYDIISSYTYFYEDSSYYKNPTEEFDKTRINNAIIYNKEEYPKAGSYGDWMKEKRLLTSANIITEIGFSVNKTPNFDHWADTE